MKTLQPRVAPLPESEWTDEQSAMVQPARDQYGFVFNVLTTLMRNMPLLKAWNSLAGYLMTRSGLSPRHRELLIMRVAWKTQSEYEWGQHILMSRIAGLTPRDHRRIQAGPDNSEWNAVEAALLRAADELLDATEVSDGTWTTLSAELSEQQLMDMLFTVGQYNMLAMALNTLRVAREPNVPGFD